MQVINWLELQPLPADLEVLRERLRVVMPLRSAGQVLVETILRAYPWTGRTDLIPCYHPSQTYKQDQKIALLIHDSQNVHPTIWHLAQVKQVKVAENRAQGRFQVLTLEIHGRQIQMAGGITGASYPEPDLYHSTAKDFAWLVEWVTNTYAARLQVVLKKLIEKREICGQLANGMFLPEQVSALSPELFHSCFDRISPARPWVSLEEIYKSLPDLSPLKRETVLALAHAALKESPYRSLGAGRWTTAEMFHQLNREVPLGLPMPPIRANVPGWTKRDEKDLVGYDNKFMPTEARHVLEELGFVERMPEPDESLWRPPKDSLRLPALNYLHMTQTYFAVGNVLHAFAPGIRMVFVQFINGDHQPFLLDRENGLLKAVQPEKLRAKILKEGIPAGTSLWLEYEGDEKYRIAPRLLPFKRMVPCKLAHLENSRLHIEHTQVSMMYEGNSSLFKADLRSEEIDYLFAEASRVGLGVRDATINAIQELSATDPDHRAHRLDIFNAVFLQRMCSPHAVALLLYTQPCFEQLADCCFRYKPAPVEPVRNSRKRKDRLSKLWDNLLSDRVTPNPVANEGTFVGKGLDANGAVFPTFTPDLEFPPLLMVPESEISVPTLPLIAVEENTAGQTFRQEETHVDILLLSKDEPVPFTPTDMVEPASNAWANSLDRLLQGLVELSDDASSHLAVEETALEQEVSIDESIEVAHEESLSFPSPFRWEPKPSWLDVPVPPKCPVPNTVDARQLAFKPKIPIRPLHKQPFYRRIFFYLRGWLNRTFRKTA